MNERFGGCGSVESINMSYEAEGGIMAEDAVALFKRFYARANVNTSESASSGAKNGEEETCVK